MGPYFVIMFLKINFEAACLKSTFFMYICIWIFLEKEAYCFNVIGCVIVLNEKCHLRGVPNLVSE